jgi:hypothetical protein
MARAKSKEIEADTSFNPSEFDPAMQPEAVAVIQQVADATTMPPENGHASQHTPSGNGHAAAVERKPYIRAADPYGFENRKAGENRVQLLKSDNRAAWVIRFAHNPNDDKGPNGETYGKANPHPVLQMLKDEGYSWNWDADGKPGWGKAFIGDAYGQDHIDARRVLQNAADMIGHTLDQGRIPD